MNPNKMTIDECRDWLARDTPAMIRDDARGYWCMERDKYEEHPMKSVFAPATLGCGHAFWYDSKGQHPFPPTLDAAARALPSSLRIMIVNQLHESFPDAQRWHCSAILEDGKTEIASWAPTELLARFRLAVACRMASKEKA